MIIPLCISAEDFISHYEYGQMLYINPRGVSCIKCHGEKGEGKVVVSYLDDNNNSIDIRSPDITKVSLTTMIKALNSKHKIMPSYYLTNDEIKTIYDYIQKSNTMMEEEEFIDDL